jgi:hypothetical protein
METELGLLPFRLTAADDGIDPGRLFKGDASTE